MEPDRPSRRLKITLTYSRKQLIVAPQEAAKGGDINQHQQTWTNAIVPRSAHASHSRGSHRAGTTDELRQRACKKLRRRAGHAHERRERGTRRV